MVCVHGVPGVVAESGAVWKLFGSGNGQTSKTSPLYGTLLSVVFSVSLSTLSYSFSHFLLYHVLLCSSLLFSTGIQPWE